MSSADDTPFVTVAEVVHALEERARLAAQLSELDRKIEGIRTFIGEERFAALSPAPAASLTSAEAKEPSFRSIMQAALEAAPDGLTYPQLREALVAGGFGERLQQAPNSFFNTIARFVQKKDAIKAGGLVVWKTHASSMSDEELNALQGRDLRHSTPEAVVETLTDAGRPLSAASVIDVMSKTHPDIKATAIYAALSRMTKDRTLKRDENGRYSVGSLVPASPGRSSGDGGPLFGG